MRRVRMPFGALVVAIVGSWCSLSVAVFSCSTGPTTLDAGFLSERYPTLEASVDAPVE